LRYGNQRQRNVARRKIAGRDRDDLFDFDAGEKPDGAIHSGFARFAEQDDPVALR
jgi:hypothetical protein